MSDLIDLKNSHRPIRVGVVLVNSCTEILDVAPIDIFSGLSKEFLANFPPQLITEDTRKQALDVEFHWVNESGAEAHLTAGATIKPTHTFETCPKLDILLMGAHEMRYIMTDAEVAFVKKCYNECQALLFICGGFLVPLQAGLLEGKTATGPRPMLDGLRKSNPEVNWVTKRWTHDGKIWTSGALLNGTDMTKAFALGTWGGGEDSFVEFGMRLGGYPYRDVDYKDVPWTI
ncbi:hypothetical protein LTR86_007746 [Recurvomyces mirabilis]|nr:hypothetical protein LTR86_007746 [Recurvomyces mirabilis]